MVSFTWLLKILYQIRASQEQGKVLDCQVFSLSIKDYDIDNQFTRAVDEINLDFDGLLVEKLLLSGMYFMVVLYQQHANRKSTRHICSLCGGLARELDGVDRGVQYGRGVRLAPAQPCSEGVLFVTLPYFERGRVFVGL